MHHKVACFKMTKFRWPLLTKARLENAYGYHREHVFSVISGVGGDRSGRGEGLISPWLRRGGGDYAGAGMLLLAIFYVIIEFRSV